MQQLMSMPTPQTTVLAKDKAVQSANNKTKDSQNKDDSGFLSFMLNQLSTTKTSSEVEIPLESIQKNFEPIDEIKSLSVEEATFGQLLQFLEAVNTKDGDTSYLNLSSKLKNILSQESVLQEFKNAKNLEDIMKLSKTYDLGLQKLTITSSEAKQFEKIFPNLAQKGFFELKNSTLSSQELLTTKNLKSISQETQKEQTVPTLKDLLSGLDKSESGTKTSQIQKDTLNLKEDFKTATKIDAADKIKTTASSNTTNLASNTKVQIDPAQTEDIRLQSQNRVESNVASHKQSNTLNTSQKDSALKTLSELSQNSSQNHSENESSGAEKESSNKEGSNIFNRENIKVSNQQLKSTQLRQTFSTFAKDFKQQIEQYKPPMMKVQMALNPKNLGEVEVTIVNRGNNLHVNFTSNTHTLSLFVQNQAEFKNSLVNMGFTNLEMNFSQKDERNQDPRNASSFSKNSQTQDEFEEEATLELVLPNYV